MSRREMDIADMQCWVFRMAQQKWDMKACDCADLFKKYDLLGFISECYELLHVSSYEHALSDVEDILHANGVTDMAAKSNTVSDKQKNYCAINIMKRMLIKYAQRNNLSFEDAMLDFVKSSTYEALFDYDTAIWKEGPDYLMALYKEEQPTQPSIT